MIEEYVADCYRDWRLAIKEHRYDDAKKSAKAYDHAVNEMIAMDLKIDERKGNDEAA